jgi:DNA topoisomerase-3
MNRPRSSSDQTVFRAFFSAITEKDVKHAMSTLGSPNHNESLAVDARQELDLRLGVAFTRFQTRYFQGKYGDLDSSLISFGPCQTPTLGFCVARHDVITKFQPEPYWVLDVTARKSGGGSAIKLEWERVRVFDQEVAALFHDLIKGVPEAKVIDVERKERSRSRPAALNTVELMRNCSAGLGMGPHHAMQVAERLYIRGYISYPRYGARFPTEIYTRGCHDAHACSLQASMRLTNGIPLGCSLSYEFVPFMASKHRRTETTQYSENFDFREALLPHTRSDHWGEVVSDLLSGGMVKPKRGVDNGDHPPITPMLLASQQHLSGDEWRVYDLVARHFIATLSPDLKYIQTNIRWIIGEGEGFKSTGKIVTDPGFTRVMHWLAPTTDEVAASVKVGERVSIELCKVSAKHTSPPGHLTESELISLMEKHGIGTLLPPLYWKLF